MNFTGHVALSFVVGSLWATLTSVLAERFGTKIGGFIGGLPSTAAVALLFIGLSQSPAAAAETANVFPLVYGFTGLFLVLFAVFTKKGFVRGLSAALIIWFGLNTSFLLIRIDDFLLSLTGAGLIFVAGLLILEYGLRLGSTGPSVLDISAGQMGGRILFSGGLIALAVTMARFGGPIVGAVFSALPAVFLSVLVIAYRSGGLELARRMTKSLFVTGMTAIIPYAVAVRTLYPVWGLTKGTLGAYAVSLISSLLAYILILRKLQ